MASKNKTLFDLLAGLDTKKSAEIMGKDLADIQKIIKSKLKPLKLETSLNDKAFKNVEKALVGTVINAKELKKVLIDIKRIEDEQGRTAQRKKAQTAITAQNPNAQSIKEVKSSINETDNSISSITYAIQELNGEVKKLTVNFDGENAIIDDEAIVSSNLEADLKSHIQNINKFSTALKSLNEKFATGKITSEEYEKQGKILQENIALERASEQQTVKQYQTNQQINKSKADQIKEDIKNRDAVLKSELEQSTAIAKSTRDRQEATKTLKAYETLSRHVAKLNAQANLQTGAEKDITLSILKDKQVQLAKYGAELSKVKSIEEDKLAVDKKIAAENNEIQTKAEKTLVDKQFQRIKALNAKAMAEYQRMQNSKAKGLVQEGATLEKNYNDQIAKINLIIQETQSLVSTKTALNLVTEKQNELLQQQAATQSILNDRAQQVAIKKDERVDTTYGKVSDKDPVLNAKELMKDQIALQRWVKSVYGAEAKILDYGKAANEADGILGQLSLQLNTTGEMINKQKIAFDAATGKVRELGVVQSENRNIHKGLAEQIHLTTKRLFAYVGASSVVYGAITKFREGVTFIMELDKQLTQIAITQNLTRSSVQSLGEEYNQLAQDMGKTTLEVSTVGVELVRQGLAMSEVKQRMDSVLKLSAVGAISTAESMKVLTSAVNAMKVSAQEASDVLILGGQLSASSVEELGEAFQKVASSAYASNMKFTETTAILATMTEVTQEDASSVGTALKTIIARFNNLTDAAEEGDTAINKVGKAFEAVGVAFTDSAGQVRNVYDVLEDTSKIWGTLDKNTKSWIATQAAGLIRASIS